MVTEGATALQAHVLTLNRGYVAFQVITARRAFCLLIKGFAEVINVEEGHYRSYDFQDWQDVSELKLAFGERGADEDWINAVNFSIEVPRVIRLLPLRPGSATRRQVQPTQHLPAGSQPLPVLPGDGSPQAELSLDHVCPSQSGWADNLGQHRHGLPQVQCRQGRSHAKRSRDGTCHPPTQTHPQPTAGRDR
ncbi:MAG: hypothetical protein Ct9H300mP1_19840 [Planctomycetaceae bacterium]|nr:MAG: hypothetical protein Ct9H300mP1_19840 [Planctomycetaceae bacterium]